MFRIEKKMALRGAKIGHKAKFFLRSVKRDEEEGGSVFLSMTFEPPFASSWLAAYLCDRGT